MEKVFTDTGSEVWGGSVSLWLAIAFFALVAAWFIRRRVAGRFGLAGFLIKAMAVSVAVGAVLQTAMRVMVFETPWHWVGFALAAGFGVEALVSLYRYELRGVAVWRQRGLLGLRTLVFLLALFMMLQPVWVRLVDRRITRRVVVLLDDSDSMHFRDTLWSLSEKLDIAAALGKLDVGLRPLGGWHELVRIRQRCQAACRDGGREAEAETADWTRDLEAARAILRTWLDNRGKWLDEKKAAEAGARLESALRGTALPALDAALNSDTGTGTNQTCESIVQALLAAEQAWPAVRAGADEKLWKGLSEDAQAAMTALCHTNRSALAQSLLFHDATGRGSFWDRLAQRYDVELWRFGSYAERWTFDRTFTNAAPFVAGPATDREDGRDMTDTTLALETVLRETPGGELAGVLVVGDGIHNSDAGIEPVAERLTLQGTRVGGLIVGGSQAPFDLAIVDAQAPDTVYAGDRMRIRVTVQATRARGKTFGLRLLQDGDKVDEIKLKAEADSWRHEARLTHSPAEKGVYRYTVELERFEDEFLTDNNTWSFDVAVSEDRINVLLVDSRPRWEFRYLRNLFYGRDTSVHLQYMLTHPDRLPGWEKRPSPPPASAQRAFGDAEAGAWPENREEWEAFHVIILGDIEPDRLTDNVLEELRHVVAERGALLVLIAGPRAMPHAFESGPLSEMIPVTYRPVSEWAGVAPESAFRFTLTPAGRTHSITRQSPSVSENESIWREIPEMRWRFPVDDVKPGGEILAYARPLDRAAADESGTSPDIESVMDRLDQAMEQRQRNALVVASEYGRGRVLAMMTDRLWRLRYRKGDVYHHRFWGQVIRWGAGELLREGDEHMRIGTDQWRYGRRDQVRVVARLTDAGMRRGSPNRLNARVTQDGQERARLVLRPREGAPGMYEGETGPFPDADRYRVDVSVDDPVGPAGSVGTEFAVVEALRPVEMATVSADPTMVMKAANITDGLVTYPVDMDALLDAFGEGRRTVRDRLERPLWNSAWIFLLIMLALAGEWILRKKGGLT
jgi:hypothetical protein